MNLAVGRRRVYKLERFPSRPARRIFSSVLFIGLGIAGCAKVGDPLPPAPQPPPTTQSLRAEAVGGRTVLQFRIPSQDVQWIEIHRQCDFRTPVERMELLARLSWAELQESDESGVFSWEDRQAKSSDCRYALRFVDERGLRSELSNLAVSGKTPGSENRP